MSSNSYESLNELRLQNTGCDVVFEIGAYEFPAHRVVLMTRIEYFQKVLTPNTTKKKKSTIELDQEIIDPASFSDFLNYVYTSKIDFTNENIRAIFKIAEHFRFDELIDKVKEHIESNMEVDNVVDFRNIAKELGLESLEDVLTQFIFQQLLCNINESKEKLIPILLLEHWTEVFEKMREAGKLEELFLHSVDWILKDEINRSGMLLNLLKNIPIESLSFDFLKKVAFHYSELIRKDSEYIKLFFDAFITASNSDIQKERRQRIDSLYAIGGCDVATLSSISRYNNTTRVWTATTPMPSPRTDFGCVVIGHKIYLCGGNSKELSIKELTMFDTHSQKWIQLTPMKHARQNCSAAVLNGQIYVAGDSNGTDGLGEVERCCFQTQRWQELAPLPTKRSGLELVAFNELLYAIGGWGGRDALNIVERYDPRSNQWTLMSNTNHYYQSFGSVVWNGCIYIAGHEKCEMYSFEEDKWSETPAPSDCYYGRRLAVYNDELYLVGGELDNKYEEWKGNKFVEVFDFQTQVWRPETNMNIARCYHGVAVIASSKMKDKLELQNVDCDVILKIGNHEFSVHREVLITRVEHFKNILIEKENESLISLDSEMIDSAFFEEILNYIYTSKITFTNENIRSIYKTAEYLRFDELLFEVKEHIEFTANIENVRSYLPITIEFGLKSLQGIFTQFIFRQIFSDIQKRSREKLIPILSIDDLGEILQKFERNKRFEKMFHYTVDWIVQDDANRSEKLLELFKKIPLQKLSLKFLIEVVSQNGLIRTNDECLNLLLSAVIAVSSCHTESRGSILYAIGGKDGEELSSVSQYNSMTREWTAATPMLSPRTHFGCAVIGQKIYICGGAYIDKCLNELTVFDTLTQKWTQLTPFNNARYNCAVAALNGQIYVAGGWNETAVLAVVERYDVETDQWKNVAPMTTKRTGFALVALNELLYAIGGHSGGDGLNIVERYHPQNDQWSSMNHTNNPYRAFGAAVLNDEIYIAGENKCEVYSETFKKWTEIPAPSVCTGGRRLAVFDGKLYAIGGRVGEWQEWKGSKAVEVYDSQTRVWKPEPDMDVARCFHCVAVVEQ